MISKKICIIGEVIVDVTASDLNSQSKVRLGGVCHAARSAWALGIKYDILYIAPSYLCPHMSEFAKAHNGNSIEIGKVNNAPNVILIKDRKESGSQGYELLLQDQSNYALDPSALSSTILNNEYSDILILSGAYDMSTVVDECLRSEALLHIDVSNQAPTIDFLKEKRIETFITSTSSEIFKSHFESNVGKMTDEICGKLSQGLLLKENRGGSRFFSADSSLSPVSAGAQIRNTEHSVGVGDCFDIAFMALREDKGDALALTYASWIASEYAATTFPENFKKECERVLSIKQNTITSLGGVILPWERRREIGIYIAAPDFDYVEKKSIDQVGDCLKYHNFDPRFPVRENGQMRTGAEPAQKKDLFYADIELLNECQILIAVLVYNDPGTLIEIGYAYAKRKPVIVYDPDCQAENLMLTELPDLITPEIEKVVEKVFELSGRLLHAN